MNIPGVLSVHCSANLDDNCDFFEESKDDKTQCIYNSQDMECLNDKVCEILTITKASTIIHGE
jgi:hypothetical protein